MKTKLLAFIALALSGCTTPQPVGPVDVEFENLFIRVLQEVSAAPASLLRATLALFCAFLVSCAGGAGFDSRGAPYVVGPIMSKVDKLAITADAPGKGKIRFIVGGFDGTGVIDNLVQTGGIAYGAGALAGVSKAKEVTAQKAAHEVTAREAAKLKAATDQAAQRAGSVNGVVQAGAPVNPLTISQ